MLIGMSVAAAVRIDSPEAKQVVARAAEFARGAGEPCYVISIVDALPHGSIADDDPIVSRNLAFITAHEATIGHLQNYIEGRYPA